MTTPPVPDLLARSARITLCTGGPMLMPPRWHCPPGACEAARVRSLTGAGLDRVQGASGSVLQRVSYRHDRFRYLYRRAHGRMLDGQPEGDLEGTRDHRHIA
jgi:hypothetical protein